MPLFSGRPSWRGPLGLAPWVVLLVDGLEARGVNVGVYLRGGDISVTEHLLDASQVGPAGEQLRGEAVAERVGADAPRHGCPADVLADDAEDVLAG